MQIDPSLCEINSDLVTLSNTLNVLDVPSWNVHKLSQADQSGVITYNTSVISSQNCTMNSGTGVMTTTVAGRYLVWFSGFTDNNVVATNICEVFIRKNGSNIVRSYCDKRAQTSYYYGMHDISVIIDLDIGDTVDVYCNPSYVPLHGNQNCSFGGFLLG